MRSRDHESGFTLPELLVAITILGIIIVVIGAMITTAFRTTSIVSAELQGSRAPKVVSRYWTPDVEQASTVSLGGGDCGGTGASVVAFESPLVSSAYTANASPDSTGTRTITWCEATAGTRDQLVRRVDEGGPTVQTTVIVSDLSSTPHIDDRHPPSYTITVVVPDTSRSGRQYSFDVTAASQVTTTTTSRP